MQIDEHLDARGLLCPLPVLKARKKLHVMAPGRVLEVVATDPASVIDIPHFCTQAGHRLVSIAQVEGGHCFTIERGEKRYPESET